jgi:hypothetical protein
MSLITRRLFSTLITKGLGSGETESLEEKVSIGITNNVKTDEEFYPLTGTYGGVSGWKWNKTFPQNLRFIETRINEHIGGYSYNLEEGTKKSHWYGGVLSGCQIKSIEAEKDKTARFKWVPKIETGTYSIYHFDKKLFSSFSCSKIVKENLILLEDNILKNSLEICLFKRDSNFNNIPIYRWAYNDSIIESNKEYTFLSDVDPSEENADRTILVQNIDPVIVGNQEEVSFENITNTWEYLGKSTKRNICYTEYFPIDNVKIALVKNRETIIELKEIESFNKEITNDYNYVVDKHSGKVVLGNYREQRFYIKEDLGNSIELFEDTRILPETGFINQNLVYKEKTKFKLILEDQTRTPLFSRGDEIVITKKSFPLIEGWDLYVSYKAYPRLDYEIKEETFSDSKINIKPYKKLDSGGILEISPQEKHLSYIKLEADKNLIGNNIYDKLFVQGDSSIIKATAYNSGNKVVPEVLITFEAEMGRFEGDSQSISKVSNLLGSAITSYSVPYVDYDNFNFVEINHIGNNTRIKLSGASPGNSIDDFYLFQVLKTDPYYGSLGNKYQISSYTIEDGLDQNSRLINVYLEDEIEDEEEYETYQVLERNDEVISTNESMCQPLIGNYGYAYLYQNSVVSRKLIIHKVDRNKIVLFDKNRFQDNFIPDEIVIFKRNELEFNGNGIERVGYLYDENIDKFVRIKPTRIDNNYLWYENILLPLGSLTDKNNLIAGYKVYYGKLVKLTASAVDPASGRLVRSNDIRISIDLPNFLKGKEDGFRFIDDITDDSSGLGFANFISINPTIQNQINLFL